MHLHVLMALLMFWWFLLKSNQNIYIALTQSSNKVDFLLWTFSLSLLPKLWSHYLQWPWWTILVCVWNNMQSDLCSLHYTSREEKNFSSDKKLRFDGWRDDERHNNTNRGKQQPKGHHTEISMVLTDYICNSVSLCVRVNIYYICSFW